MKEPIRRIEVAGGIASGKTTLARLLSRVGLMPLHENFRRNPFYLAFYQDPVGCAFETEITFLLQHYHEQRISRRSFCADFSLVLDEAYANVTLSKDEQTLFHLVLQRARAKLMRRSLLLYLRCTPGTELKRIKRRRRRAERRITVEYLAKINDALERIVTTLPDTESVMTIDSAAMDFAHDAEAKAQVVQSIRARLG